MNHDNLGCAAAPACFCSARLTRRARANLAQAHVHLVVKLVLKAGVGRIAGHATQRWRCNPTHIVDETQRARLIGASFRVSLRGRMCVAGTTACGRRCVVERASLSDSRYRRCVTGGAVGCAELATQTPALLPASAHARAFRCCASSSEHATASRVALLLSFLRPGALWHCAPASYDYAPPPSPLQRNTVAPWSQTRKRCARCGAAVCGVRA